MRWNFLFAGAWNRSPRFQVICQTIEAADPALLVHIAKGLVGNEFVRDDDFRFVAALLKLHGDALKSVGLRFELPGVAQFARGFDALERSGDPQNLAVGKLMGDAIAPANPQVD